MSTCFKTCRSIQATKPAIISPVCTRLSLLSSHSCLAADCLGISLGLCAISTTEAPMVLAIPLAEPTQGVPVRILRYTPTEIEDATILTHPTSYRLAQLALNRSGDKLATASENVCPRVQHIARTLSLLKHLLGLVQLCREHISMSMIHARGNGSSPSVVASLRVPISLASRSIRKTRSCAFAATLARSTSLTCRTRLLLDGSRTYFLSPFP